MDHFGLRTQGRGLEERQQRNGAEAALALRPIRRRGGERKASGDGHFTRSVRTDYADRFRLIWLRAPDQGTLGVAIEGS